MHWLITAMVLFVVGAVLVVVVRARPALHDATRGAGTTRDRRSGRDRRLTRVSVPFERRRGPRRHEEIADDFVRRLENRLDSRSS